MEGAVPALELRGVSHGFGRGARYREVLHDVSLVVPRGEVVGLVGESGCGKTTLGRIAAGLIVPERGQVFWAGTEATRVPRALRLEVRRRVQIIHQDPYAALNPAITVGESLIEGLRRHGLASRRNARERAREALELVGLQLRGEDVLAKFPHELSGGQRQRVVIARALALRPDALVADEAVSMLDVSSRVGVLDIFLRAKEELGVGILFISHDLGVVRYVTQGGTIAVLLYGVCIEKGPSEPVIAEPAHPYTQLLLDSLPVPDPRRRGGRLPVSGVIDDAGEMSGRGCVFSSRCPLVVGECMRAQPRAAVSGDGREVACLRTDDARAVWRAAHETAGSRPAAVS
jgi:oligopeptide/dipeptide ABC transporter ATP-binding protein